MLRNFALAILMVCTFFSSSALAVNRSRLYGYNGISFGESKQNTVYKMNRMFTYKCSNNGNLIYSGEVGGYKCLASTAFINNKFQFILFMFYFTNNEGAIESYYDLVGKLKNVYGEPTASGWLRYGSKNGPSNGLSDTGSETKTQDEITESLNNGEIYLAAKWNFSDGNEIRLDTERDQEKNLSISLYYSGIKGRQEPSSNEDTATDYL